MNRHINMQHVTFAPKYRRQVLNNEIAETATKAIIAACQKYKIKLLTFAVQNDHVHIFIDVDKVRSVSYTVQQIKRQSSMLIRRKHPELKRVVHKRYLWQRNYWSRSVGGDERTVRAYIRKQIS